MNEDALDEQRELVALLEAAGWDVTETELSVYESPWEDDDSPEATVTLTARKPFPDEMNEGDGSGAGDGSGEGGGDDESRFRVQ